MTLVVLQHQELYCTCCDYPLINVYKTMETRMFCWTTLYFYSHVPMLNYQRVVQCFVAVKGGRFSLGQLLGRGLVVRGFNPCSYGPSDTSYKY